MSAQAAQAVEPSAKNSIESIISEFIDISAEMFDLKEDIVAKGVPMSMLNALVELVSVGKPEEISVMRTNALKAAKARYGLGAIKPEVLDTHVEKLVDLEEDLVQVRKVAKANKMEPQAVNLLTSIIRQNPGDKGSRTIGKIVEYARACDIKVNHIHLVSDSEIPEPESVLPKIDLPEDHKSVWRSFRQLSLDIVLGMLLAFCAISLLT